MCETVKQTKRERKGKRTIKHSVKLRGTAGVMDCMNVHTSESVPCGSRKYQRLADRHTPHSRMMLFRNTGSISDNPWSSGHGGWAKIVGLVPVRNEERRMGFCLRALAMFVVRIPIALQATVAMHAWIYLVRHHVGKMRGRILYPCVQTCVLPEKLIVHCFFLQALPFS